jgi:hypothetical protein
VFLAHPVSIKMKKAPLLARHALLDCINLFVGKMHVTRVHLGIILAQEVPRVCRSVHAKLGSMRLGLVCCWI